MQKEKRWIIASLIGRVVIRPRKSHLDWTCWARRKDQQKKLPEEEFYPLKRLKISSNWRSLLAFDFLSVVFRSTVPQRPRPTGFQDSCLSRFCATILYDIIVNLRFWIQVEPRIDPLRCKPVVLYQHADIGRIYGLSASTSPPCRSGIFSHSCYFFPAYSFDSCAGIYN